MTDLKSEYDITEFADEDIDSNNNILALIQSNPNIGTEVAKSTEVFFV